MNGSLETSIPFIQFHGTTNVFLGTPAGHTIPTEMYSLLEFGPSGSILRAGDLVPNTLNDGPLHSPGSIVEQGGNPFLADSFFDVFFEIDLGGGYVLHNNTPLQVQSVIDRAPPIVFTIYQTLNLPLDLFDVANVKRGELHPAAGVGGPFPHHIITPEPSALGLMGLGLGAVVLLRRRFSR